MRLARRMLVMGGAASPERHALPFDGLVDLGYAQGVRTATGTQYALVHKVASTSNSGTDNYATMLSDPAKTGGGGRNITDGIRRQISTGQRYGIVGLNSSGGLNYSRTSNSDAVTAVNTAAIAMVSRDLTANTAHGRVVGADGVIRWTFGALAAAEDTQPLDLVIGCATNHLFAPFAGTYFAHHWVASVILNIIPTDDQLQAYAAGYDARTVWAANVIYYVTATSLIGLGSGPIPPVVGTANLTLSGPVEGDLVPYA